MTVTYERDFTGKTALVTGGAGGIGAATVRMLARRGAIVTILDADSRAHDIADEIGGSAIVADICDDAAQRAATGAAARDGRLDMLVNSAGIQVRTGAADIDDADWRRLVDVNLGAPFAIVRAAVPALRAARGSIVNVASLSADRAVPGIVPYGATKAALTQLTRGLAVELGPDGIRANAVAPGYVATPMTEEVLAQEEFRARVLARVPLGRLAEGRDIADVIGFLLSDAARYITGVFLPVDGGYSVT